MDISRLQEAEYRLSHRHGDGSWGVMTESPLHHGAVEHDPERSWGLGRLFRCGTCDEEVTIVPADADGDSDRADVALERLKGPAQDPEPDDDRDDQKQQLLRRQRRHRIDGIAGHAAHGEAPVAATGAATATAGRSAELPGALRDAVPVLGHGRIIAPGASRLGVSRLATGRTTINRRDA